MDIHSKPSGMFLLEASMEVLKCEVRFHDITGQLFRKVFQYQVSASVSEALFFASFTDREMIILISLLKERL